MKKLILVFLLTSTFFSKSQNLVWVDHISGSGYVSLTGGLTCDIFNNIFVTGYIYGVADFDPGPNTGTIGITSQSTSSQAFAKYDVNGNLLWVYDMGYAGNYAKKGVTTNNTGDVFLTGLFGGTTDFDFGPGTATVANSNTGSTNGFFAKYSNNGNYNWVKTISGNSIEGRCIKTDPVGNIYVAGTFTGTADLDPGAGVANLTSATNKKDLFFAKYDSNGNYLWAKTLGSKYDDIVNELSVDATGNVVITGDFRDTVDFDPGPGVNKLVSYGGFNPNGFLAKYDSNGNYLWAFSVGASGINACLNTNGEVHLLGRKGAYADDFDPGPGVATFTSPGMFFAKYTSSGNYLWASVVTSSYTNGSGMTVDNGGNIYITGNMGDASVDFDPGPGIAYQNNPGSYPLIFLAAYDPFGNYVWAYALNGLAPGCSGVSIAVDGNNQLVFDGNFAGCVDFDAGANTDTICGGNDGFIAKYTGVLLSTGINSSENNAGLLTYPNPNNGVLNITGLHYGYSIRVIDLTGNEIYNTQATGSEWRIDLSNKAKGLYILEVKDENGSPIRCEKIVLSQ